MKHLKLFNRFINELEQHHFEIVGDSIDAILDNVKIINAELNGKYSITLVDGSGKDDGSKKVVDAHVNSILHPSLITNEIKKIIEAKKLNIRFNI